jgi:hypothetical protein
VTAYRFAPDTKFAAIHLCGCSCRNLPDTLQLNHGLSAHTSPVMALSDLDRRRIGEDYAKAFEDSPIALMASMPSRTAGILDAESEQLEHRAYMLLYGVFLQGVPQFWPGIITIGSTPGDQEPWANRIVIMDRFYRHRDAMLFRITPEALRLADGVVPGLMEVFPGHETPAFTRIRRGVNSLIAGWKAGEALNRLHMHVRALDGLMKLTRSAGEKQFVERTMMLASGTHIDGIAREIFRLRSYNEHLDDWPTKLAYVKERDRQRFVSRRAFQAEVLAGETYRRMLSDPRLRRRFRTADEIEQFWNSGATTWTPKIDMDAHDRRFRFIGDI